MIAVNVKVTQNLEFIQLVLLKEGNDKITDWKTTRTLKFNKGVDGLVRVIGLKISKGIVYKNIKKIIPLPFYDNF